MASELTAQTYYAQTKSGRKISETAVDANTIINYREISDACDNILKAANDGMNDISTKISNVQIGADALTVADKNMQGTVDEIASFIKGLPEQYIASPLEELKSKALTIHNEKQEKFNQEAHAKVDKRAETEE